MNTRRKEIENTKGYNNKKDHIYTIDISNLGKLKQRVDAFLKDAEKNKYGKTVEVSFFTHAGMNGPLGSSKTTGEYSLENETGDVMDANQLSMDGWRNINWNLDPKKNILCSYGCNTASWASQISEIENVQYAAGQDGRTGGTYSLNKWNSVWIPFWYENVYQRSALDGNTLSPFIYRRGIEVSSPDNNPIKANLSYDIVNQALKKTSEGVKK